MGIEEVEIAALVPFLVHYKVADMVTYQKIYQLEGGAVYRCLGPFACDAPVPSIAPCQPFSLLFIEVVDRFRISEDVLDPSGVHDGRAVPLQVIPYAYNTALSDAV